MRETVFQWRTLGGRSVVQVHGDVDIATAPNLEATIDAALAESSALVVDLSDCTYIDSSALTVLLKVHKRLGASYPVILGDQPFFTRLFEITGIGNVLELHQSLNELEELSANKERPDPIS